MNMTETGVYFADMARSKGRTAARAPVAFFVASMLAGAYVGIALILALTCSFGLPAGVRPLVTGSVFGLGLILVVLAGAEMFTGHVMYETFGLAKRTITPLDLLRMFVLVWLGNLAGSVLLAFLFAQGGGGSVFAPAMAAATPAVAAVAVAPGALVHPAVAAITHPAAAAAAKPLDLLTAYVMKKETSPFWPLLCRAILCNWLVCLAIWLAARCKSETAKMIGIAWCLLAFVACGFEHSVANMTTVSLGLFAPTPIGSVAGAAYNLAVVTLGNLIGGGLFVAGAYLVAAQGERAAADAATVKSTV